jgi:hypothetical protein
MQYQYTTAEPLTAEHRMRYLNKNGRMLHGRTWDAIPEQQRPNAARPNVGFNTSPGTRCALIHGRYPQQSERTDHFAIIIIPPRP